MKKIAYFLLEDGIYCGYYNNPSIPEQQRFLDKKDYTYTMEDFEYDTTDEYTKDKYYQLINPRNGYRQYFPGNALGRRIALCTVYLFPEDILLYTYVKHNEYSTTKVTRFCSHRTGYCYGRKFYGTPTMHVSDDCKSILNKLGIGK